MQILDLEERAGHDFQLSCLDPFNMTDHKDKLKQIFGSDYSDEEDDVLKYQYNLNISDEEKTVRSKTPPPLLKKRKSPTTKPSKNRREIFKEKKKQTTNPTPPVPSLPPVNEEMQETGNNEKNLLSETLIPTKVSPTVNNEKDLRSETLTPTDNNEKDLRSETLTPTDNNEKDFRSKTHHDRQEISRPSSRHVTELGNPWKNVLPKHNRLPRIPYREPATRGTYRRSPLNNPQRVRWVSKNILESAFLCVSGDSYSISNSVTAITGDKCGSSLLDVIEEDLKTLNLYNEIFLIGREAVEVWKNIRMYFHHSIKDVYMDDDLCGSCALCNTVGCPKWNIIVGGIQQMTRFRVRPLHHI